MQPGARPPQGAGQAHRTSVLRNPTITVEPASQQAAPGVTTEIVLAIVNNSDTVSDFTVELDDRRIGWIRIEPATKNLWPGSRDLFRVLVTPPRSAEVRAGLKGPLGLTITSSGIPGGVANATDPGRRAPVRGGRAADGPRRPPATSAAATGSRSGRTWDRRRGRPGSRRRTPEEALRSGLQAQISVGPGDTAVVGVTHAAKAWNIIGSTQPHPFTVDLEGGEGTKQRLDANHNQRAVIPGRLIVPLLAALALIAVGGLWALGVIPPGGGATASPSLPTPSEAVVTSGSPPPSAPPSETPSESAPPSEEPPSPSESTSAKPDDVDQWAWDRYLRLLSQGNPFDVGKPIGGTADTSDGIYRVQWFEFAVMYQPKAPDPSGVQPVLVVRPPILAAFPLQPISPDRPVTGYPIDARKGQAGRVVQAFEDAWIVCADDTHCYTLPNAVHDLWLPLVDTLGSPTADGQVVGSDTYYLFENGRIVDAAGTLVSCDANGQVIGGELSDCAPFMVGP